MGFNNRFRQQKILGLDESLEVLACKEFIFQGFSHLVESKCWITLIKKDGYVKYVVCSQLEKYYGTSITNAAEIIRKQLIDEHHLSKDSIWLEHYKRGLGLSMGKYSLSPLSFDDNNNPSWDQDLTWETASEKFEVPLNALTFGFEDELSRK